MIWLGLPEPPVWQLVLYFLCIGMFGVGVGMLYTPILVDRMQLSFPSGFAVANILRALTDIRLLKPVDRQARRRQRWRARGRPRGEQASADRRRHRSFSASTLGAGMIVGARIGIPAIVVGAIGLWLTPWLRANGWLGPHDPFRKIGFIAALGMILGAAIVDMSLLAVSRAPSSDSRGKAAAAAPRTGSAPTAASSAIWVVFWALAVLVMAIGVLEPAAALRPGRDRRSSSSS